MRFRRRGSNANVIAGIIIIIIIIILFQLFIYLLLV